MHRSMISRLWIYPPLAVGRVGPSKVPCDNFSWVKNNSNDPGSGKTTIQPAETLNVSEDGTITSYLPENIRFKDLDGFKPVCPFFELYAEWNKNGKNERGPLTHQILESFNLTVHDLKWKIDVANLKPFQYTLKDGDKVISTLEIAGDDTKRYQLRGGSPPSAEEPLVLEGEDLPLGSVQLTKSTDKFPGFRFRFTPASGWVYGPRGLESRYFNIPVDRLILNKKASWCNFQFEGDYRTIPIGLYVRDSYPNSSAEIGKSLGLTDDICDGIIGCSLNEIKAFARITVAPPKYAPDRRHFTSLADGLADRTIRNDISDPTYVSKDRKMTFLEVQDFVERIIETLLNMNVDVLNQIMEENGETPFTELVPTKENKLPLTSKSRKLHDFLLQSLEKEEILSAILDKVREPRGKLPDVQEPDFFDRKMPALMRGSDGFPMHITRRQYNLLLAWASYLRGGETT